MDLTNLSKAELDALASRIPSELKRRESTVKQELMAKFKEMAREAGVDWQYIIGGDAVKTRSSAGVKIAPKYRNPGNAAETWTGRGRAPKWVEDCKAKGATLESLLIK